MLLGAALAGAPAAAQADAGAGALAMDLGCYNCHGSPPRKGVPGFEELAADLAKHRGDPEAAARLGEQLRKGDFFHRVVAHRQLSADSAARLMQWLIDGAK
jgi:cytochrome c